MKHFTILFGFCSLFCSACHKEETVPEDPFTILPSSASFLSPYYGKDQVVFEDSLGHELIFKVEVSMHKARTYIWNFYDVNMPGDTVQRSFPCTGDLVTLMDDSKQHRFTLEIFPALYIPEIDSNTVKAVDKFYIFFQQASSPHTYSVFSKILNARDSEEDYHHWFYNILIPNQTFLGLSFPNVEHSGYINPKALAYYNTQQGIVAFSDYNQILWRLKP